jgi:hypothetical protein
MVTNPSLLLLLSRAWPSLAVAGALGMSQAQAQQAPEPSGSDSEKVQLVFQPEVGLAVQKVWTYEHELLSDPIVEVRGEQVEEVLRSMRVQTKHDLEVIDHYRAFEGSRLTNLRRRFETATRNARVAFRRGTEAFRGPGPFTQESQLQEGVGVVFEWHEEAGEYGKHFDATERDEWSLRGLIADMDFRDLLPDQAVAVGESWEVDPQVLLPMLSPGGEIPYEISKKADKRVVRTMATGVGSSLYNAFGGSDAGTFRMTLKEVVEREGRRLAVIDMAADFKLAADRTHVLSTWLSGEENIHLGAFEEATLSVQFQGPGILVWNLDEGHVQSLGFVFQENVHVRLVQPVKTVDGEELYEQKVQLYGTLETHMVARTVDPPAVQGPAKD